jgi:hypothetical protein
MNVKRHMDSVSVVLKNLKMKRQDTEFFILAKGQLTLNGKIYKQKDVKILRTYRFEGESDPADQAIIYVIKTGDGSMGYCIDGYGMYSSHTNDLYHDFLQHATIGDPLVN